jgi:Na+-driven multidrug efflux pump
MKEKENRQEHPLRAMARFGWRPTITALFLSMQAITTTFFVSQIGVAAVATIAIALSILSIPRYLYLSVGQAVRYFTANAKDNNTEAVKYIVQGSLQACFFALVLGGGTAVLAGQLLRFYMDDFTSDGVLYLQIAGGTGFLPALFGVLSNGLKAWDRKEQKITTRAEQATCLFCIPLDWVLIYLLDLGLVGAACTMVLSNMLGTVWLFKRFLGKAGTRLPLKVDWRIQKEISSQAFAIMVGNMANQIGMVLYFHIVASTGTDSLAAVSTLYTVQGLVYLPWMRGIIETIHLVVNPAKDSTEQVARYIRWTLSIIVLGTFVAWAILHVLAEPVVGFITDDADVTNLTVWLVLLYSMVQAPWAIYASIGEVLGMRLQAKTSSIIFTLSSVLLAIACWKLPRTLEAVSWAEILQYSFMAITSVVYLCGLFKGANGVYLFPIRATIVRRLSLLKVHYERWMGTHVEIQHVPMSSIETNRKLTAFREVSNAAITRADMSPVFDAFRAYDAITHLGSLKLAKSELPLEDSMNFAEDLLCDSLKKIAEERVLQEFLAFVTGASWPQNNDSSVVVQRFLKAFVQHAKERAEIPKTTRDLSNLADKILHGLPYSSSGMYKWYAPLWDSGEIHHPVLNTVDIIPAARFAGVNVR